MSNGIKTMRLRIGGMTCVSCQNKIEKKLHNTAGINSVKVSYSAGTADISYDTDIISLKDITAIIEKLDYSVLTGKEPRKTGAIRAAGLMVIIAALYLILQQFGILNLLVPSKLAEANMGYGMLFVIGLITSVHCVAMCGGINLSQCIPKGEKPESGSRFSSLRPTFLYNLGRVISYTVVGFIVGALGSAITFSNTLQGVLKLVAGVFMVIMGINMLGIFPWLRRLNPRMPKFFANKIGVEKARSNSPLIVGLLNGLMPCGPLQAMQIYALSTGNPFAGALSMLLFSLGTVPLMFGLGALSSVLGRRFTQKVMTVGAVLVVVLGLSMFSQGWTLSGVVMPDLIPSSAGSAESGAGAAGDVKMEGGVQVVNSTLQSGRYPAITVQAGTPVKWVIDAPEGSVNGCNNRMLVSEYGIEHTFKVGENVIEFTPTKTGKFQYSCWMGMIRGSITVVEAGVDTTAANAADASATDAPTGGSCCGAAGTSAADSSAADAPTGGSCCGAAGTSAADAQAPVAVADPVPAGVKIPTDNVAIAELKTDELGEETQTVEIDLTDKGFSPAIVVIQGDRNVDWNIRNALPDSDTGTQLLVPAYQTQVPLESGENPLYFTPIESFDFSTGDNAFYGYVKAVDDLDNIDIDAIKAEVAAYKTLIYPPEYYSGADSGEGAGSGASCH